MNQKETASNPDQITLIKETLYKGTLGDQVAEILEVKPNQRGSCRVIFYFKYGAPNGTVTFTVETTAGSKIQKTLHFGFTIPAEVNEIIERLNSGQLADISNILRIIQEKGTQTSSIEQ